jgi:hypothetical protein
MWFRRFAVRGSDRLVKKDGSNLVIGPSRRFRSIEGSRLWRFESALSLAFVLLVSIPLAESPSAVTIKGRRAQEIVDQLRAAFPIRNEVQIAVVAYHPLVFSVEPIDKHKDRFLLSMEIGFLLQLDDDELHAALAHELGHVWIYTHHPFLQTERLANIIGQRVADRAAFEKVYSKLWAYERTSGVPLDDLLGPRLPGVTVPAALSGVRP